MKKAAVLQSLKKLQTDYVDIVLLHSNGKDEEKILEGLDCLKKLKEKGLLGSMECLVKLLKEV